MSPIKDSSLPTLLAIVALVVAMVGLIAAFGPGPEGPEGPRGGQGPQGPLGTPGTPGPPDAPIGSVVAFLGSPELLSDDNWLVCHGQNKPSESYPKLALFLHGSSFSEETFSLPNLQGLFLRGIDQGSGDMGGDPDGTRLPGSAQDWMIADHAHAFPVHGQAVTNGVTRGNHDGDKEGNRVPTNGVIAIGDADIQADLLHDGLALDPKHRGVEVRPKNSAVHWIIKAR